MNYTEKDIKRFWSKIDVKGPNECWEWKNITNDKNYGILRVKNKNMYIHRVSAEIAGMDIINKFVCHHCDNPKCVNPKHLFTGLLQDNVSDMVTKKRQAYGERHGNTPLTEQDAEYICKHYIPGKGRSIKSNSIELAEKFNVSDVTIRNIAKRKTWVHL